MQAKPKTCDDCDHKRHSGINTSGGIKTFCGHDNAISYFTEEDFPKRNHWMHRIVERDEAPPALCPIKDC